MSEAADLPPLPEDRIEPPPRRVGDVKTGERVVLSVVSNIDVDEEGHVWVNISSPFRPSPVVAGLTLRAERTEKGFILWLDKKVKFRRGRLYSQTDYLPVVEFREAQEEND